MDDFNLPFKRRPELQNLLSQLKALSQFPRTTSTFFPVTIGDQIPLKKYKAYLIL